MLGISFFFGYINDPDERAKLIKDTGFECIITNQDKKFSYQNSNIKNQIRLFKKYGLKLSSLHMAYNSKDLPAFWEKGIRGHRLMLRLIKDVKTARKYGFNSVVVHLKGTYSQLGKKRLLRVLKVCEKLDILLAIENINHRDLFIKTFDNIQHPYLKFCYDSGHNHCYDPDIDYLDKYGDKLVALHLHDNMGKHDEHTLNMHGSIDWDNIAMKLAKLPPVNLDYEILMVTHRDELSIKETLEECFKQATELQTKIEKYRKTASKPKITKK